MKNKFNLKTLILASMFMNPALSLGSEFRDVAQTLEFKAEDFPAVLALLTDPELIAAKANFADTTEQEYKNLNYFMERSLDEMTYMRAEPVRKLATDQALRQQKYVSRMQVKYRDLYAHAYLYTLNATEKNQNLLASFRLGVKNGWLFMSSELSNPINSDLCSIMSHSSGENEFILSSLIDGFAHQKLPTSSIMGCFIHSGNLDQFYDILFRKYEEESINFQIVSDLVLSSDIFSYYNNPSYTAYSHILSRFYREALKKHQEKDDSSKQISELFIEALKSRRKMEALTPILQMHDFHEEVPFILAHLLTKDAPVKIKSHQVAYFLRSVPQSTHDFYSLAILKYQAEEISLEDLTQLAEPGKTNIFYGASTTENLVDRVTISWNMAFNFDKALKELTDPEALSNIKDILKTRLECQNFDVAGTSSLDLIMDSIID